MNRDLERLLTTPADEPAAAAARRAAVLALRPALRDPGDQLAAGELLLAGQTEAELDAAHALLLAAMGKERRARRLAAEAYDRLRCRRGQPQKFGLVAVASTAGRGDLWPVDPSTTDSERAKWDVPALAELRRRAAGGAP